MTTRRLEGYSNMFKKKLQPLTDEQHPTPLDIVNVLSTADPTPNKSYIDWLIKKYIDREFVLDNIEEVKTYLSKYDSGKQYFEPEARIINNLSYSQMKDVVEQHYAPMIGFNPTDSIKGHYIVLYSGALGILYRLLDHEGACELGKGTKWCTTSDKNMFLQYSDEGPLYVYIDRLRSGTKIQIHLESSQIKNEIDLDLPKWKILEYRNEHPVLKQLFKHYENKILATEDGDAFQTMLENYLLMFDEGDLDSFLEDVYNTVKNDYLRLFIWSVYSKRQTEETHEACSKLILGQSLDDYMSLIEIYFKYMKTRSLIIEKTLLETKRIDLIGLYWKYVVREAWEEMKTLILNSPESISYVLKTNMPIEDLLELNTILSTTSYAQKEVIIRFLTERRSSILQSRSLNFTSLPISILELIAVYAHEARNEFFEKALLSSKNPYTPVDYIKKFFSDKPWKEWEEFLLSSNIKLVENLISRYISMIPVESPEFANRLISKGLYKEYVAYCQRFLKKVDDRIFLVDQTDDYMWIYWVTNYCISYGIRWPNATVEQMLLNWNTQEFLSGYAVYALKQRWSELENKLTEPKAILFYINNLVRTRVPELEKHIAKDPASAVKYFILYMKDRFPEAEKYIINSPQDAVLYAIYRNKRWPEAERYIALNSNAYISYVLHFGQTPYQELAESYILQDPITCASYAVNILRTRWRKAEYMIKSNKEAAKIYTRGLDIKDLEFQPYLL